MDGDGYEGSDYGGSDYNGSDYNGGDSQAGGNGAQAGPAGASTDANYNGGFEGGGDGPFGGLAVAPASSGPTTAAAAIAAAISAQLSAAIAAAQAALAPAPAAPAVVADVSIGQTAPALSGAPGLAASPNAQMSVEQQYAEYGAGRMAAEVAAGYGLGGPGPGQPGSGYSATVGTPAQQSAFLSGRTELTPAEQIAASDAAKGSATGKATGAALGATVGGPLGSLVGGWIGDVLGGLAGAFSGASNPSPNDLGFAGNLGATSGGGYDVNGFGSAAPSAGESNIGNDLGGGVLGSPVLGYGGEVIGSTIPTQVYGGAGGGTVAPALGLGSLFAPGRGLTSASGFNTGTQQQGGGLMVLLGLAAALYFGT